MNTQYAAADRLFAGRADVMLQLTSEYLLPAVTTPRFYPPGGELIERMADILLLNIDFRAVAIAALRLRWIRFHGPGAGAVTLQRTPIRHRHCRKVPSVHYPALNEY